MEGVEARYMEVGEVDDDYVTEASAVIFGSPTYMGTCSWQLKKYLDSQPTGLANKLGGVFASQNWPGGGGGRELARWGRRKFRGNDHDRSYAGARHAHLLRWDGQRTALSPLRRSLPQGSRRRALSRKVPEIGPEHRDQSQAAFRRSVEL